MSETTVITEATAAASRPSPPEKSLWGVARYEIRETLILGLPLVGAQLAQILLSTTDTIMAGQVSPRDVAYVALGGSIWFPVALFGVGVLFAVSPTVSQLYGAERYREIGPKVHQSLWLALMIAAVTFTGVQFCEPLLRWNSVQSDLIPGAVAYLNAICWGLPALYGQGALRGMSEGVSRPRPLLVISLLSFPLNIFGNWVFINGHFGIPRMGGVGCGAASAIVLWANFAVMVAWVRWYEGYRPYNLFHRWEWPHASEMLGLFRLGIPIGIGLFMECTLFAAGALLLGRFGEEAVAAHQSALNMASVTFMIPLGVSMAASVRVGQAVGRRDPAAVRRAGFTGIFLSAGIMVVSGVILATLPAAIAAVYTRDAEVARLMARLLVFAAVFQVFDGLQVSSNSCLRGLKDTAVPAAITVIAYWGIGFPLAWWLAIRRGLQADGIWYAFIASLIAAATLLTYRFHLKTRLSPGPGVP